LRFVPIWANSFFKLRILRIILIFWWCKMKCLQKQIFT